MQHDLLKFALVKLLVYAPLFNTQKKHVLNYFALEMAAIIVGTTEIRGFFFTHINLFGMPEEHIIRTYHLPSHVIFNLLQEIKDDLDPQLGVTQCQVYQNFLQPFIFWPPVLFNVLWLLYLFILYLRLC